MTRASVLLATAALALPGGAAAHTIDLSTGRVDGQRILGRTVAGVTAALGRPDFRTGPRAHYALGWGDRRDFSIRVIFRPAGGVERAWSIAFERDVRDTKLGDLLGRRPPALQRAVAKRYADRFRLVRPYACRRAICAGEFGPRAGALHLTFGTRPGLGTWLTVWEY